MIFFRDEYIIQPDGLDLHVIEAEVHIRRLLPITTRSAMVEVTFICCKCNESCAEKALLYEYKKSSTPALVMITLALQNISISEP